MSWSDMRALVLGLSIAALVGCGFHLRGAGAASAPDIMNVTRIQADQPNDSLPVLLQRELQSAGAELVARGSKGTDNPQVSLLRIHHNRVNRRVLSVGQQGNPREIEYSLQVSFSVRRDGRVLLPRQQLSMVRNVSYEANEVLSQRAEADEAVGAMRRDMVRRMIRRLGQMDEAQASESS